MNTDEQERFELEAAIVSVVVPREKSKYFIGNHGQVSDLKDFDTARMIEDFSKEFPTVPKEEIRGMINVAIYYHYLR
jgi:hypothetical protein